MGVAMRNVFLERHEIYDRGKGRKVFGYQSAEA